LERHVFKYTENTYFLDEKEGCPMSKDTQKKKAEEEKEPLWVTIGHYHHSH
jgi:hypothetical protein